MHVFLGGVHPKRPDYNHDRAGTRESGAIHQRRHGVFSLCLVFLCGLFSRGRHRPRVCWDLRTSATISVADSFAARGFSDATLNDVPALWTTISPCPIVAAVCK